MPGIRLWFQWPVEGIVKVRQGAKKAEAGLNLVDRAILYHGIPRCLVANSCAQPFGRIGVTDSRPKVGCGRA
jgi:hypothetical protein